MLCTPHQLNNITLAIATVVGRFGLGIPALALAGSFARQGRRQRTEGALPTDNLLFGILTIETIVVVGALNYLPMLAVGPIIEQLILVR